jgi:hypothetical protein
VEANATNHEQKGIELTARNSKIDAHHAITNCMAIVKQNNMMDDIVVVSYLEQLKLAFKHSGRL